MKRRNRPLVTCRVALVLTLVFATAFCLFCWPAASLAQEKPKLSIEEDCQAFAYAPDGNIAYAVERVMKTKHYDLERDDIWVVDPDGRKKRIVDGQKLVKTYVPFSYAVRALAWSPDSQRLAVEMDTEAVVDNRGNTKEEELVDLMNAEGKEIKIEGMGDSVIHNAYQAAWLGDGVTVAFLTEAVKPKLLFAIGTVRPAGGRGGTIFPGHAFSAVAWDAKLNSALAVERNLSLTGPIQLVRLDLLAQTRQVLATLDGFLGQLTLSPLGDKVAYFRDGVTLEIRPLDSPARVVRVPAAYGHYAWATDERRILLKRGTERESNDIVWVTIPSGNFTPILHDLTFRDFAISPDGRWLALTQPGRRNLLVYPLP